MNRVVALVTAYAVRRARALSLALAVIAAGAVVVFVATDVPGLVSGRRDTEALATGLAFTVAISVILVVAARVLATRPNHPVGWCLALLALSIVLAGATDDYARRGLIDHPGSLPAARVAANVSNSAFIVWLISIGLICSLTPDGTYLSERWRRASRWMVTTGLVWLALRLVSSEPLDAPFESVKNPWAIHVPAFRAAQAAAAVGNNLLVVAAVVSLFIRFHRAHADHRRQLLWMVAAMVPFPLLVAIAFVAAQVDNQVVLSVAAAGFVVLPATGVGLAVTGYRLYDVERVVSRTASYVIISILLATTYVVVVVVAARLIGQTARNSVTATTLATLAVVAVARPQHAAVQDGLDRRFSRRRFDALQQVRAFVAAPAPGLHVDMALREALHDPEFQIAYFVEADKEWVSEDGAPCVPGPVIVNRAGRTIAAISHSGDPKTVAAVIELASPTIESAGLRAAIARQLHEVVASRRRIAEAQLVERRRIERDLHDGAQQRLLGAAAQLQAALLNGDAGRMRQALEFGMGACRTAVGELRDLANGLHPAVLADGGLAAAFDQLAATIPLDVTVTVSERRYPAEVEATAWFVACEASSNAVKHAGASKLVISVNEIGESLELEITDDGCGGADPSGSGLRGLADRVEAIGGTLNVATEIAGGTRIEAVLPCGS